MSNARLDFPDPDNPVNTVKVFRGMEWLMHLRLCSLAPTIVMYSVMVEMPCPHGIERNQPAGGGTPSDVERQIKSDVLLFVKLCPGSFGFCWYFWKSRVDGSGKMTYHFRQSDSVSVDCLLCVPAGFRGYALLLSSLRILI